MFLGPSLLAALLLRCLRRGICLYREENIEPRALTEREHPVGNFIHRIFFYLLPAEQAVGAADAGKEQTQIIEDLGGGSDGRARVARGVFLFDRDRRRDPVDYIDVRLLDALEKLSRICRQRFDISALPFGVNRIEGERGL